MLSFSVSSQTWWSPSVVDDSYSFSDNLCTVPESTTDSDQEILTFLLILFMMGIIHKRRTSSYDHVLWNIMSMDNFYCLLMPSKGSLLSPTSSLHSFLYNLGQHIANCFPVIWNSTEVYPLWLVTDSLYSTQLILSLVVWQGGVVNSEGLQYAWISLIKYVFKLC